MIPTNKLCWVRWYTAWERNVLGYVLSVRSSRWHVASTERSGLTLCGKSIRGGVPELGVETVWTAWLEPVNIAYEPPPTPVEQPVKPCQKCQATLRCALLAEGRIL